MGLAGQILKSNPCLEEETKKHLLQVQEKALWPLERPRMESCGHKPRSRTREETAPPEPHESAWPCRLFNFNPGNLLWDLCPLE